MFKMDDVTGEQKTRQGDSYWFRATGIPADWDLFYSVYNIETQERIFEIQSVKENGADRFDIPATESDKLVVSVGEPYAVYGWGIKRVKNGIEDTTMVTGRSEDDINKIIVLPKTNEGVANG